MQGGICGGGSRGTSPSLDLTFPPTGLSEKLSSYTWFNTLFLSPFWLVAVLPVAVLVCRRFGHGNLSPFWRVAVLVCRRFDHTPHRPITARVL